MEGLDMSCNNQEGSHSPHRHSREVAGAVAEEEAQVVEGVAMTVDVVVAGITPTNLFVLFVDAIATRMTMCAVLYFFSFLCFHVNNSLLLPIKLSTILCVNSYHCNHVS